MTSLEHGNQGIETIDAWAHLVALVTRAAQARQPLAPVLAPHGLDEARYWQAADHWNARMTADLRLAARFSEIMVRETGDLLQAQSRAHAEAHEHPGPIAGAMPPPPGLPRGGR